MPAGDTGVRATPSLTEPTATRRLDELVRRYARLVHSAARRVGGSLAAQHSDDIEQRVFLAIWKQISREQEIEHPSSYIYRAAVRETVRVLKGEQRHQRRVDDFRTSEATGPESMENPQKLLQARETGKKIEEVLGTLALERQRAVRAHLRGFGVREIMKLEGWPYNRARNLIARGMADLRRGLRAVDIDA